MSMATAVMLTQILGTNNLDCGSMPTRLDLRQREEEYCQ